MRHGDKQTARRTRLRGERTGLLPAAILAATTLLAAATARAAPHSFTLTGDLTGTLGGQSLSNQPFTWTVLGDANAPTTLAAGIPALPALSDTISLPGIGSAALTIPSYVAQSQANSAFGFITGLSNTSTQGITWSAPVLANPALTPPVAPALASFNLATPLPTTLGTLDITSASNLVFSANGGLPPPPAIVYALSGRLSGSLGGTAFADRAFTWSLTAGAGDAPLTLSGPGVPALFATGDALAIDGIGALIPNQPFFAAESAASSAFGFITQAADQGLAWSGGAFASYVLGAPLGAQSVAFGSTQPIDTLSGQLVVTEATNLTFSAQIVAAPEPAALALLGVGLLGLAAVSRRRRVWEGEGDRPYAVTQA